MELDDAVLVVLEQCGDYGAGRTALQKLLYFLKELGVVETSFRPHYYGPFSQELAASLSDLVSLGFVEERLSAFSTGNIGYVYQITSDGREVIGNSSYEDESKKIASVVKSFQQHFGFNQTLLAAAAKVHYILKTTETRMTPEAIASQARELGWKVSGNDVERVVSFLKELGLVQTA